jgi:hypothetical protein
MKIMWPAGAGRTAATARDGGRRTSRIGAAGAGIVALAAAGLGGGGTADAAQAALVPVPCSTAALRAAIAIAPGNSALLLAPGCRYRLSSPLPDIDANLTILGNYATLRMTVAGTILETDSASVGALNVLSPVS